MLNPFFNYIGAGLLIFVIFFFKWSNIYQELDLPLVIFIVFNMITSLVLGMLLKDKLKYKNPKGIPFNPYIVLFLIYLGFIINLIYAKEIPIVNLILKTGTPYKDIQQIPSFYPILTSVNVFFIIYYFFHFTVKRERKLLMASVILFLPPIANMGRGIFIMSIIPIILIFLSQKTNLLKLNSIFKGSIVIFLGILLFGYLGNLKSNTKRNINKESSELILELGEATPKFKESYLPKSFFWVYLYSVSPVCNLNNTINISKNENGIFKEYIVYNFLPQSFQKRILGKFEKDKSYLVKDTFNVSTAFALPYLQFGWFGLVLFQILLYLGFIILLFLLQKSDYKVIFLALFSTIMMLSWFANILVLDVIFIPILLCLFLAFIANRIILPKFVFRIKKYNKQEE